MSNIQNNIPHLRFTYSIFNILPFHQRKYEMYRMNVRFLSNYCKKRGDQHQHFYIFALWQIIALLKQSILIIIMSQLIKRSLRTRSKGPFSKPLAKPEEIRQYEESNKEVICESTNSSFHVREEEQDRQIYRDDPQNDQYCENAITYDQVLRMGMRKVQQATTKEPSPSDEATNPIAPRKFTLPHDDSNTRKFSENVHNAISKEVKKVEQQEYLTANKSKCPPPQKNIQEMPPRANPPQQSNKRLNLRQYLPTQQIPKRKAQLSPEIGKRYLPAQINQKVQEIQQKDTIRNRFLGLLVNEHKYSIGLKNMALLRLLRTIDSTIDFKIKQRQARGCFFTDLVQSLYRYNRMELTEKSLKQLLFINDRLFELEWQYNQSTRRLDLLLRLPYIRSEDERVGEVRRLMFEYMIALQVQFLAQSGQKKTSFDGWAQGFDPDKFQLPEKNLPPTPEAKRAEIGQLTHEQIAAVPNPHLRRFMQNTKDQAEVSSLRSEQVSDLIFAKKDNQAFIKQLLNDALKKKESRLKENALLEYERARPEKAVLANVCSETIAIFFAKGVTNIIKETLIETLSKKMSYKQLIIQQSLTYLLASTEIDFLKQVTTSKKLVVVQINRSMFKPMMEKINSENY